MEYRTLVTLRQKHPAWRLLVADHAPLIIGFLHEAFIRPNIRTLHQTEITSRLDDYCRCNSARLKVVAFDDIVITRETFPLDPHFDLLGHPPNHSRFKRASDSRSTLALPSF